MIALSFGILKLEYHALADRVRKSGYIGKAKPPFWILLTASWVKRVLKIPDLMLITYKSYPQGLPIAGLGILSPDLCIRFSKLLSRDG